MSFTFIVLGILLGISLISCLFASQYFAPYAHLRISILLFNLLLFALWRLSYSSYISLRVAGILDKFVSLAIIFQVIMALMAIIVIIFSFLLHTIGNVEINNGRRNFLRALIWLPSLSLTMYGSFYEAKHIEYTTLKVPTTSPKMNGLTAVQLSDVHLGNYFPLDKLREVMTTIIKNSPDMLLITGDIFDDDHVNSEAINMISKFAPQFPLGVYFCWGNHEYFHNIPQLRAQLERSNIKLLNNASIKILDDINPVYVLGVDYVSGSDDFQKKRETCVQLALHGIPENAYKILLAHHPIFLDNAFKHRINLTLSGHTHGGQFAILDNSLFPVFKYMMGKFEQNNCIGYVSRGAGSWFPCRIGCPPEITTIEFEYKA